MESLGGAAPTLDWQSGDLPGMWKAFRTHVEFMFNGPLKEKSEELCNYLMIWVGQKGRELYSTWNFDEDQKKGTEIIF